MVVIDARRARQGAADFAAAQAQMRDSAVSGAKATQAANESTVAKTLEGLDREIARRKAVSEALRGGADAARTERAQQEALNTLRKQGVVVSAEEVAQIRAKVKASQDLANAQAAAFRKQVNEEREKTPEARAQALEQNLGQARGWIGDACGAWK